MPVRPLTPAQKKLAEANLPLVTHSIRKYVPKRQIDRYGFEDLFQIGCFGLLRAAFAFDEGKGFRFSTFAVKCILTEIRCHIRNQNAKRRTSPKAIVSLDALVDGPADAPSPLVDLVADQRCDVESAYCTSAALQFAKTALSDNPKLNGLAPAIFGHQTQRQVAEKLGCRQSNVSRCISDFRKQVRDFCDE